VLSHIVCLRPPTPTTVVVICSNRRKQSSTGRCDQEPRTRQPRSSTAPRIRQAADASSLLVPRAGGPADRYPIAQVVVVVRSHRRSERHHRPHDSAISCGGQQQPSHQRQGNPPPPPHARGTQRSPPLASPLPARSPPSPRPKQVVPGRCEEAARRVRQPPRGARGRGGGLPLLGGGEVDDDAPGRSGSSGQWASGGWLASRRSRVPAAVGGAGGRSMPRQPGRASGAARPNVLHPARGDSSPPRVRLPLHPPSGPPVSEILYRVNALV
jgi:hypothetical protein